MEQKEMVKICSVRDRMEAEMLLDILKQNGIPAYRQGTGSWDFLEVYGGNSFYGEELYVRKEHVQKAGELVKEYAWEEGNKDSARKVSKAMRLFILLLLTGVVVFFTYSIYTSLV